jgi:hypothetical protein
MCLSGIILIASFLGVEASIPHLRVHGEIAIHEIAIHEIAIHEIAFVGDVTPFAWSS